MCPSQALTPTPWISPVVSHKALFWGRYSAQCSSMIFPQLVRKLQYKCMQMTILYAHSHSLSDLQHILQSDFETRKLDFPKQNCF
ncbi:hypothetical protein FKM82_025853 [Ascaphus truei]